MRARTQHLRRDRIGHDERDRSDEGPDVFEQHHEDDQHARHLERFLDGQDDDLGPTTLLLSTGIIDSFGILEVLEFVRARFGIVLPENEIHAGNMEHLAKISETLLRVSRSV